MDVPETRYAQSGDTSIAYQVFGEGPYELVLTPGFVSHLDLQWTIPSFADFAERLGSMARVIIFDKRGTGLSDPTLGAVRFDTRVDDIRTVMAPPTPSVPPWWGFRKEAPSACCSLPPIRSG